MTSKATLIVGGFLRVAEAHRDEFVARSRLAMEKARVTRGCLDFSVSPDSLEPDRVNVFEAWISEEALHQFRGDGPDDGLFDVIESAHVSEYRVKE